MAAKLCIGFGVFGVVIGVLFIFIGIFGVHWELERQKMDYLIIDSTSSPQYSDWAGGYDQQNEYDMIFYFYNLTNADDVRQAAATPVYDSVGPYVYRRFRQSIDVSFPDGGEKLQYVDFRSYQYQMNASTGLSNLDYIVNLNPVYVSAVAQAGSEMQMLAGATGGYLPNFTSFFTGPFISLYISYSLSTYLPEAVANQIAIINDSMNDTTASTNYFYEQWSNGTGKPEYGSWTGLLLSTSYGGPTGISSQTAQMLLNPSVNLSLSNSDPMTAWTWFQANVSSSYAAVLIQAFGITPRQMSAIRKWYLDDFGPTFIYAPVMTKYNLTTISELGWVQYLLGLDILGAPVAGTPVSIKDLFPVQEIGYYYQIELWINPSYPDAFDDWQSGKNVFDNTNGLGNMVIFQSFATAMENETAISNYSIYAGMSDDQAQKVYGYCLYIGVEQIVPALMNVFGDSGGLILTQTVDDWVFNCNPFLVNLLLPVPISCSLLMNESTYNSATVWSGKNQISRINTYIEWNGFQNITGIWNGTVQVQGSSETGQFPPNQNSSTHLSTWNDEFVRTMYLNYSGNSSVQNIDTNRFFLDYDSLFSVNSTYWQSIPGFTNQTTIKQAPIFYSLWDMLHVDDQIRTQVVGIPPPTDEFDCSTYIDIEPITGSALLVRKRLQANIYVPGNCTWCADPLSIFNNTNFPSNIFFPLVKAGEYSEINPSLAKTVKNKLDLLTNGKLVRLGMIIGLSVGVPMSVLGIILLILGGRRMREERRYDNYKAIGT